MSWIDQNGKVIADGLPGDEQDLHEELARLRGVLDEIVNGPAECMRALRERARAGLSPQENATITTGTCPDEILRRALTDIAHHNGECCRWTPPKCEDLFENIARKALEEYARAAE